MRARLGHDPIKASRGPAARTRAGLAAVAVLGASVAGVAVGGTASAATSVSATTTFTAHPDSGNHGNWANDNFARVATVTLVGPDTTVTDCGSTATICYQYTGTISDGGGFAVIAGAKSPQAGVTITGTPGGNFKGGSDVKFFASSATPSASGVPATVTGAGPVTATDWVELFFATGTTFGTGPTLTDWSWAYSAPGSCENWVDAISNSSGSLPADGDITGVNHCLTATGPISTFVNHSASCLDNSNFKWVADNPQQIWTCGAAGGHDQNFRVATYNGAEVLQAVAPAATSDYPWCVTAPGAAGRLTIQACTGMGGQIVKKGGPYYVFTATGDVMDLRASSTVNGNAVIAYPKNGGKNQQWSLP